MKRNVALFDLDDTLIDIKSSFYEALRAELGNERVDHWCLWDSFNVDERVGITMDDMIAISVKHEVFRHAKPHLFSPYILKDLKQHGYEILIVTSRKGFIPDAENETISYLKKNDLYYDNLIVTSHGQNKIDALYEYDKIDFAIDDQIKNCVDFQNSGKIDQVFLAANPHNKNCNLFVRLHNLYQVYNYIGLS